MTDLLLIAAVLTQILSIFPKHDRPAFVVTGTNPTGRLKVNATRI